MGITCVINKNLIDELVELKDKYPKLRIEQPNGSIVLNGKITFHLEDSNTGKPPIRDTYCVEITVPCDFPDTIPTVRELEGKIRRSYEHISSNGIMCLGLPSELQLILKKSPTIQGFIENIVKPNLFAYSYYKKYKVMPWGERPAGPKAFVLYYAELFRTIDVEIQLALLRIIIEGDYKGDSKCPCGSSKTLNECHGEAVYSLWPLPGDRLFSDYLYLLDFKLMIETAGLVYSKYVN